MKMFGKFVPDCIRSSLNSKFSGGEGGEGGMSPDTLTRHACLCTHEHAFAHYYHPATILFPPHPTQIPVWKPAKDTFVTFGNMPVKGLCLQLLTSILRLDVTHEVMYQQTLPTLPVLQAIEKLGGVGKPIPVTVGKVKSYRNSTSRNR